MVPTETSSPSPVRSTTTVSPQYRAILPRSVTPSTAEKEESPHESIVTTQSTTKNKRVRFPASPDHVTDTFSYEAMPKRLHGSSKQVAEWGAEIEEDVEVEEKSVVVGGRTLRRRK